jgi:crotonobetainyl-CoA:carnitine CoA-transferase CaiB-like acyl-CoA transferase
MDSKMEKALQDVRVIDLTHVLSGPFCTAMLADMGAEVIKVEQPKKGDMSREPSVSVNGESYYFMSLNRNKKGITLNLKHPKGIEILKKLISESDVLIENFRPGTMAKLGLDYESIRKGSPKIIYASISGFGQNSPLTQRPAFDLIAQAMGGIMSINGHADGPPTRVGVSLGDTSASLYTAFAIMVALYARQKSGEGQYIDVAMVDSVFSLLEMSLFQYLGNGEIPMRIGSRHPTSYPYDTFADGDGNYFTIATFSNTIFERLCEAMDMPELMERPEFSTDTLRGRPDNSKKLKSIIERWAGQHRVDSIIEKLESHNVPVSPIHSIKDICESEHARARGLLVEVEHPNAGSVRLPTLPVKFSSTPAAIENPSPMLGQHNQSVLSEILCYSVDDIEELKEQNVI